MESGSIATEEKGGTSNHISGTTRKSHSVYKPADHELKYEAWRKSGVFCDVTVIVDGKRFSVHKLVLCSKTPLFETMLLSSMKEAKTNEIVLKDIELPVFEQLLEYIYTGVVSVTEDTIVPLVKAAHIYEADALVKFLDGVIAEEVSTENCVDWWLLGDQLKLESVTDRSSKFASQHLDKLENSADIPFRFLGSLEENGCTDSMLIVLFYKWVEAKKPVEERAALLKLINLQRVQSEVGKSLLNCKNLTREEQGILLNCVAKLYFDLKTSAAKMIRLTSQGICLRQSWRVLDPEYVARLSRVVSYKSFRGTRHYQDNTTGIWGSSYHMTNVKWMDSEPDADIVFPQIICFANYPASYDILVMQQDPPKDTLGSDATWRMESCRINLSDSSTEHCVMMNIKIVGKSEVVAYGSSILACYGTDSIKRRKRMKSPFMLEMVFTQQATQ